MRVCVPVCARAGVAIILAMIGQLYQIMISKAKKLAGDRQKAAITAMTHTLDEHKTEEKKASMANGEPAKELTQGELEAANRIQKEKIKKRTRADGSPPLWKQILGKKIVESFIALCFVAMIGMLFMNYAKNVHIRTVEERVPGQATVDGVLQNASCTITVSEHYASADLRTTPWRRVRQHISPTFKSICECAKP